MNQPAFIECVSLSKKYNSKGSIITALDNIDLRINENQIALIKGRSGAGKSTLLNLMCGLVRPTTGRVIIGSYCISELSDNALSRILTEKIGIIFQSFNLLPAYTVYENIEFGILHKGIDRNDLKVNVLNLLEEFGLKGKESALPSELSAGQQQKVAIIRSLIKKPSIIFADEPTGSVDGETATEILNHLVNMKNTQKVTIVIATHGNIPENIADHVYMIENGKIAD
jgi:ABC-type lipoprotein export system ATPase subunit